jgi:hypothetical protein
VSETTPFATFFEGLVFAQLYAGPEKGGRA